MSAPSSIPGSKSQGRNPQPAPQNETNAYTDASRLHTNVILGSLHLMFWLFFHPSAWSHYLVRLNPGLPPDFTLLDLNWAQWRTAAVRRFLLQVFVILPALAALPTGLILWSRGTAAADLVIPVLFVFAINLAIGIMIGTVIHAAAGVMGGVAVGLLTGAVGGLTDGQLESIAVPTAISFAIGLAMSITGQITAAQQVQSLPAYANTQRPRIPQQIGGMVIGVVVGVVAVGALRLGLTTLAGLTAGLPEQSSYSLARAIVVGASFGVAAGWHRGVKVGLVGAIIVGLVYALAVTAGNSEWGKIPIGLGSGLLFGTSFGVTIVLPYVLAKQIGGVWAGAWAAALGSWGRHVFRNEAPLWPSLPLGLLGVGLGLSQVWWRPLLLYPLTAAWNLILYRLDQQRNPQRPSLLRWHSAFWDELQHLPLAGLDSHLLLLMRRDPEAAQAALTYLRTSRQRWALQVVQIEQELQRLERCEDLTAMSQVHRTLAASDLAGPARMLLRSFHHVSQDVEAALNQTTAFHQRLAFKAADDRLNSLTRELTISSEPYAARFYPLATSWQRVISRHLDRLALAVERSQEIDNPYVVGVPLTAQQEIFIGRTDIVARIEQLLLDRRRPPLLLYGQRRMGKTSLLRNLGRLLPRTIVPLFVDGQKTGLASSYSDFLYNVAVEIRRSAEQQRRLLLPPLAPEALQDNPFTVFDEWLDQVEHCLVDEGYQIALLALDEFEMLAGVLDKGRFDETDLLSMLRHIIQHRPRFKLMLAGSHTLDEYQRWASYLINVQVVKITYLETEEARQLIEQPIKNFALRYEPDAGRRVLELTRGHPALVQLLCYEIVALKNEQEPALRRLACLADVEQAGARALESASFFFADIQQNQIDGAGLAILRYIAAQGEGAVVSRATLIEHVDNSADLDQTLRSLFQRDLIEAVDQGYRFQVEFIRRSFA